MIYKDFLEEKIMANLTVQNTKAVEYTSTVAEAPKSGNTKASDAKLLGAEDKVETKQSGMPKLTPILYEIKDGDSLMKIANELGLKITDLVDQLKASGKLPEDYDPFARHAKDISWMKKGNKIKLSYPETEKQKAEYQEFCDNRTKEYYNKKAAAKKEAEAEAKAKARAEYDALPWYQKLFTERP